MNNLKGYGRGVNIQEIKKLDTRQFSEITLKNLVFKNTLFEDYIDSNLYHHLEM